MSPSSLAAPHARTTTHVKVCGVTNADDARAIVAAGATVVGFVFAPSPRRITPEDARAIVRALPSFVTTVGVFVDAPVELIREARAVSGVDRVQLHGDEEHDTIASVQACGARVIKAIRVRSATDIQRAERFVGVADALLFDAPAPGSGQRFDWAAFAGQTSTRAPFVVAGGLDASNVASALHATGASAVDVSSRVEVDGSPGRKCPEKVAAFVDAVAAFDRSLR